MWVQSFHFLFTKSFESATTELHFIPKKPKPPNQPLYRLNHFLHLFPDRFLDEAASSFASHHERFISAPPTSVGFLTRSIGRLSFFIVSFLLSSITRDGGWRKSQEIYSTVLHSKEKRKLLVWKILGINKMRETANKKSEIFYNFLEYRKDSGLNELRKPSIYIVQATTKVQNKF